MRAANGQGNGRGAPPLCLDDGCGGSVRRSQSGSGQTARRKTQLHCQEFLCHVSWRPVARRQRATASAVLFARQIQPPALDDIAVWPRAGGDAGLGRQLIPLGSHLADPKTSRRRGHRAITVIGRWGSGVRRVCPQFPAIRPATGFPARATRRRRHPIGRGARREALQRVRRRPPPDHAPRNRFPARSLR